MSDAMTSREIEDVLSSVRRLVSQENQRPATTRLILTEAQRVLPPSAEPEPRKQLEETIAELEAAVSSIDEAWESETGEAGPQPNVTSFTRRSRPDAPQESDQDTASPPAACAPSPETPFLDAPAPEAPEPQTAPEAAADTDEAVLDEEMLRQIVAALVREELQGQLGERVTFQVRKLVRAEISRILDERDLI